MSFDEVIESLIKEAQARGEFNNLPGKGKPIDLTEYFSMPENTRVAQTMLKNAGMVPAEIELLQEIAALKDALTSLCDSTEIEKIRLRINENQFKFNLLIEQHKQ